MKNFEIKTVQFFAKIGGRKTDKFLAFINSITVLAFFWCALVALAVIKHPEIKHGPVRIGNVNSNIISLLKS